MVSVGNGVGFSTKLIIEILFSIFFLHKHRIINPHLSHTIAYIPLQRQTHYRLSKFFSLTHTVLVRHYRPKPFQSVSAIWSYPRQCSFILPHVRFLSRSTESSYHIGGLIHFEVRIVLVNVSIFIEFVFSAVDKYSSHRILWPALTSKQGIRANLATNLYAWQPNLLGNSQSSKRSRLCFNLYCFVSDSHCATFLLHIKCY